MIPAPRVALEARAAGLHPAVAAAEAVPVSGARHGGRFQTRLYQLGDGHDWQPNEGLVTDVCWNEHLHASAQTGWNLSLLLSFLYPLSSLTAAGQGKNVKKLQLMIKN